MQLLVKDGYLQNMYRCLHLPLVVIRAQFISTLRYITRTRENLWTVVWQSRRVQLKKSAMPMEQRDCSTEHCEEGFVI